MAEHGPAPARLRSPPARSLRLDARWALAVPLAVLTAVYAYPLVRVLMEGFADSTAWQWATGGYVRRRLWIATMQATLSVLLTLAIALPLAWFHHRRALPFTRLHLALHAAPFVLPVFVVVYGLQGVFGPHGWTHSVSGLDLLSAIGPLGTVVLAHAYYNYGFAARLLHAALERRPAALEEAAQTLGASPWHARLRVTLPLLAPAIGATALLVFFFAFTSFGVVLLMGQAEVSTLETLLFRQLGGVHPRLGHAAVLGILQLLVNGVAVAAYLALRRREARLPGAGRIRTPGATTADKALSWAFVTMGLLPAFSVLVGGFRIGGRWSLEPWRAILDAGHPLHEGGFDLVEVLDRTLFYAFWSTVLALALTVSLAYGLRALRTRWRRPVEWFAALPLGTSSLLLGFGFFLAFGVEATVAWMDLRGTLRVIVLAHALVAFPFTVRAFLPALDLHDRRLDEAAALLGAPPRDVLRRIHWPLLRGPLLVAAGFAVALSLGDFGASLLLMDTSNMNLAVWVERHDHPFDAAKHAQAVALAGLLMLLAALAYLVVERARDPRRGDL